MVDWVYAFEASMHWASSHPGRSHPRSPPATTCKQLLAAEARADSVEETGKQALQKAQALEAELTEQVIDWYHGCVACYCIRWLVSRA